MRRARTVFILALLVVPVTLATCSGGKGGNGTDGGPTSTPGCLSDTACTATSACPEGFSCNLRVSPPSCAKLYCEGEGGTCSAAENCKTGFLCISYLGPLPSGGSQGLPTPTCTDGSRHRREAEPCLSPGQFTASNTAAQRVAYSCDSALGLVCRRVSYADTQRCMRPAVVGDACIPVRDSTDGLTDEAQWCGGGLLCTGLETTNYVMGTCSAAPDAGTGGGGGGAGCSTAVMASCTAGWVCLPSCCGGQACFPPAAGCPSVCPVDGGDSGG